MNKHYHEKVAEKLIEQLKQGTAPWQKPWSPGEPGAFLPINPITGKRYKGINALNLMSQDRGDQRWMTYKQAAALGAQVRKGEKGTTIQYWKLSEERVVKDDAGKPVLDDQGEKMTGTVPLDRPQVFFATVFNAEQIDGLPPLIREKPEWDAMERAERILSSSGAEIRHSGKDQAYYKPLTDSIHLPAKDLFPTASDYYATALHELGHWTGHESRLNRDLAHPFGSAGYAKEELRAEIASLMLGNELGIGHDPGQHAAYVGSWIKALEEDPREIFRAAADAEKIHEYILAREKEQEVEVMHKPEYVIADESLVFVSKEQNLDAAYLSEEVAKFSDPGEALSAALEAEEKNKEMLDGSRLSIYRTEDEHGHIEDKPVLKTGTPHDMRYMWEHNIGGNLPGILQARENPDLAVSGSPSTEKTYLAVGFEEKEKAKELGAKWDSEKKAWFVPAGMDHAPFSAWLPGRENDSNHLSPGEEFAQVIQKAGLILDGLPEMDGQIHRLQVEGGKEGSKDGAYCGYLDGRANGWIQNFRTGEKGKWIFTGHVLTDQRKEQLKNENGDRLNEMQAKAMKRAYARWINAPEAKEDHPYLASKGIEKDGKGLKEDAFGNLLIPGYNIQTGRLQTLQRISPEGEKRFEAGCPKHGAMYPMQSEDKEELTGEILIAEGYATGASLYQATGIPVAVAFDASNLLEVAENIRQKYPNIEITICADNDHTTKSGVNIGVQKAKEAAFAVGGKVVIPSFTKEEKEKGCTDFNDLYVSRGRDAVQKELSRSRSGSRTSGVER